MSAEMEREKRAIRMFVATALDQEHQAVLEGEREDSSYTEYLDDSDLQRDPSGWTIKLRNGRTFKVTVL